MKTARYLVFSFDDGVADDRRLVQLLNQYGIKATFFLNGLFDEHSDAFEDEGATVFHLPHALLPSLYQGHEVAVHTWSHPNLTVLPRASVIDELERSRTWIINLFGIVPVGVAYPFGCSDKKTADLIKELGFRYARTIENASDFSVSSNPYFHHPSAHFLTEDFDALLNEFLSIPLKNEPLILHFWGHSYELTGHDCWDWFEQRLIQLKKHKELINITLSELFH